MDIDENPGSVQLVVTPGNMQQEAGPRSDARDEVRVTLEIILFRRHD